MIKNLKRALVVALTAAFALSTLTAVPAQAATSKLTSPSGISVAYGGSVSVPFDLDTTTTGYVNTNVNVEDGLLDMTSYFNAHPEIYVSWGAADGNSITILSTPSVAADMLANIKVRHQRMGKYVPIRVNANVQPANSYVVNPANGHGYELYWNRNLNYNSAKCAAKYINPDVIYDETNAPTGDHCYDNGRTLMLRATSGTTSYLATVTSQDETNFLNNNVYGSWYSAWLGADDITTDGTWKWNAGPEAGTQFWSGDSSGSAVGGAYTNWQAGNPVTTSGATDNTVALWNSGGTITSADSDFTNYTYIEYSGSSALTAPENFFLWESAKIDITGKVFNTCVDLTDGFNQVGILAGGENQGANWEISNGLDVDGSDFASSLNRIQNGSNTASNIFPNLGFNKSYNGSTGSFDADKTCLMFNSDGSATITSEEPAYDMGNGLTVQYETKIFNDGATVRQSVTYHNSTGATVNAGDVNYQSQYRGTSYRHVTRDESYGFQFQQEGTGSVSALWGSSGTTVVTGNRFTPLVGAETTKWSQLDNEGARFDAWQNIPNAYLSDLDGTIANWGSSAISRSFNSRPAADNDYLDIVYQLGDIAAGQTKTIAVFHEVHSLGTLYNPSWQSYKSPETRKASVGHEFVGEYSLEHSAGLYTYSVINGSLPAGLSLNSSTGVISGTPTTSGSYSFELRAQVNGSYPELTDETRNFTIEVLTEIADTSFEAATTAPWNHITRQIDLGVDSIAGCQTVDTVDYSVLEGLSGGFDSDDEGAYNGQRGGTQDNNSPWDEQEYWVSLTSDEHTAGNQALYLGSDMEDTQYGYDVVHGPAVFSEEFSAVPTQVYSFDWKAVRESDAFSVFGYLLNTATCEQLEVLDATGDEQNWTKAAIMVPESGTYRFVFVAGTYDESGGQAAGAHLYLDNFQLGDPVAPVWTDEIAANGNVGESYTDALTATGFPDPNVTIVSGSLPDGLSMDIYGNITGTPTRAGQYTVKVKADNGLGTIYTTVTIIISDPAVVSPVEWTDKTIAPIMEATTPYSDKVTANIQGNNVTYSVSNGTLPAGLTLNPNTGAITGSPTTPGDYWFEVTATDGQSVLTQAFAGWINVAPPTPPVAPKDGEYHWQGNLKTKISWTAAPDAVSYVVVWRGNILCETKKTSCLTDGLVPGDNAVRIIAHFADGRTATGKAYFNGKNTRMSVTPRFATNSATLSSADKAALKKLATYLKSRGMYKVVLIGYTDVTGPVFVDTGLSLRRAQAVKAYLSKFMSTKQFTIKGLGRTTPAASNATAAGRAKNRRVEIYAK